MAVLEVQDMVDIAIPKKRAYYPASKNEEDRILCWIPREELEDKVKRKILPKQVLVNHPDGVEIDLLPDAFKEFKLDPKIDPTKIRKHFARLRRKKMIEDDGLVDAAKLEGSLRDMDKPETKLKGDKRAVVQFLRGKRTRRPPRLARPTMKKGQHPVDIMFNLQRR
jgi:hypothetical protein